LRAQLGAATTTGSRAGLPTRGARPGRPWGRPERLIGLRGMTVLRHHKVRRRVLRDAPGPPQRRLRPPRAAQTRRESPFYPDQGRWHCRPGCARQDVPIAVADFALCRVASGALWCCRCYDPASTSRVRRHRASPSSPPSSLCLTRCWTSSWADQRALVGASHQSLLSAFLAAHHGLQAAQGPPRRRLRPQCATRGCLSSSVR
jgi:hypothetical protein